MNLKALTEKRNRLLDEKIQASKDNNASRIIELNREIAAIDQGLLLYTELDAQYRMALVKMLFNEVLFRLKCRVEDEKKWWWFNRTTAAASLRDFQAVVNNPRKTTEQLAGSLRASIHALSDLNQSAYQGLFNSVSRIANDSKLWELRPGEDVSRCQVSDDPILEFRCQQLNTVFAQKEQELEGQLRRQNEIKLTEQCLGLDKIPEYNEETTLDTRKTAIERSVLNVKCPGFSGAPRASSSNVRNGLNASAQPDRSVPAVINREPQAQTLNQKVKIAIASLYDYPDFSSETESATLLEHVLAQTGKGWFRRPLEYRTVENLLIAAENRNLDEAARLDVQRRIDRLKGLRKFQNNNAKLEALKNLQMAFDTDRCDVFMPEISLGFAPTPEQTKFARSLLRSETAFQGYGAKLCQAYELNTRSHNIVSIMDQLEAEKKLPGQANARLVSVDAGKLPHTLIELQERAYFIFQKNLNPVSDDFQPFIPIVRVPQGGVKMIMSSGQYAGLLQTLEPLFSQSPSLYFVALMMSIALVRLRTQQTKKDYALLHELLFDILNRRFDPAQIHANEQVYRGSCLNWLLCYIPGNVVMAPVEKALQTRLLTAFPAPEMTRQSNVSRDSLESGACETTRDSIISVTPPRSSSIGGSFFSPSSSKETKAQEHDRKLVTEELFVSKAQEYATTIIDKSDAASKMERIAKLNFHTYPNAPKSVVLLYALLTWYIEHRHSDPNLQAFIRDCFALQVKAASYLENFRVEHVKKREPIKQLVVYPSQGYWVTQEIVASNNGINIHLTDQGCTEAGRLGLTTWMTSAGKLSKRIRHIFADGYIAFPASNAITSIAVESDSPPLLVTPVKDKRLRTLSQENMSYIQDIIDGAHAINDQVYSEIAFSIKSNIDNYPNANRNILAAYTLWQWFTTTNRWATIEQEAEHNSKKGAYKAQYLEILARLECAVTGGEEVFPPEVLSFVSKPHPFAVKPTKANSTGSISLDLLFAKTKVLIRSGHSALPNTKRSTSVGILSSSPPQVVSPVKPGFDMRAAMQGTELDDEVPDIGSLLGVEGMAELRAAEVASKAGGSAIGSTKDYFSVPVDEESKDVSSSMSPSSSTFFLLSRFYQSPKRAKEADEATHTDRIENMLIAVENNIVNIDPSLFTEALDEIKHNARTILTEIFSDSDPGSSEHLQNAQILYCVLNWYCSRYPRQKVNPNSRSREKITQNNKEYAVANTLMIGMQKSSVEALSKSFDEIEWPAVMSAQFLSLKAIIDHYGYKFKSIIITPDRTGR